MKRHLITIKTLAFMLCAVLISIVAVQCKKEGKNASSIFRGLASSDIDSTIFSPFYDTTVLSISSAKSINDSIITTGIQSIIKANCANCHNNNIKPNLVTFSDIKSLVVPGNPEASKLWQAITTNDLNKAMPPVATEKTVSTEDKISIYNWIKNGANETPALADYRPTAVRLITGGCTAQCHNQNVAIGAWARTYKDFGRTLTAQDTITGISFGKAGCVAVNDTLINRVWKSYQDSVVKFYSDTLNYAAYKPKKSLGTAMGPLNTYANLLFDINYSKGLRTNKYSNLPDLASISNTLLTRIDSTIYFISGNGTVTKANASNMSNGDGHLNPSEIAIIKGWYFMDPNVPDTWKYGPNNRGMFKDKGGNTITRK
ncbi:c-type cytochrome domain-containing protein [Pinibacter soli]|uniref:Cytochrome c domain-containing protein n=1 Tax=Pinibacter soli TaxID=3044211 RepID=A0ABT6R7C2_9BACT|nr:c-type cytochrome domain-containing protein [Pinibacter soli]MDI3318270.1 hypothetical protein [Pinibacter soli]